MNYNYMSSMESNALNAYRGDNDDLNKFFDMSQYDAPCSNGMYPFGSGFTPNGMNIDGGMGGNFAPNTVFQPGPNYGQPQYQPQAADFPFPEQPVDPAAIMTNGTEGSESVRHKSEQSEDVYVPKPKRTRRSKKKPLTEEQQEKKREEFLERNRVAVSPSRSIYLSNY
jgi:hypothetical protein